jgi:hypothetical protein
VTAILVLLALLSVATLAARRGYAAFVTHIITTPILLGLGVIISPHVLGILTPSTTDALTPAMRVGAAWLALLLGLRGVRPRGDAHYLTLVGGTAVTITLTWAALGALAFGAILLLESFGLGPTGGEGRIPSIGAALLLAGMFGATGLSFATEALQGNTWSRASERVLFLARHDDVLGALALAAAVWLWPVSADEAPIYERPELAAALVIGFGLLLAASHLLNHGKKGALGENIEPIVIALIGLVIFAAGMSTSTHLPEAPTAFFLGAALSMFGHGRRVLERGLAQTERPVRIAIVTLVGANLAFEPGPIMLGVAIALARFGIKAVVRAAMQRKAGYLPIGAFVGAPSTALAFALSFALSRPGPLLGNDILLTVAVASGTADLLALLVWRKHKEPGTEPVEVHPLIPVEKVDDE